MNRYQRHQDFISMIEQALITLGVAPLDALSAAEAAAESAVRRLANSHPDGV